MRKCTTIFNSTILWVTKRHFSTIWNNTTTSRRKMYTRSFHSLSTSSQASPTLNTKILSRSTKESPRTALKMQSKTSGSSSQDSCQTEVKALLSLMRYTSWIQFWRRRKSTSTDCKKHTLCKSTYRDLCCTKAENLTSGTSWWLVDCMESWGPIGSARATSEPPPLSTI